MRARAVAVGLLLVTAYAAASAASIREGHGCWILPLASAAATLALAALQGGYPLRRIADNAYIPAAVAFSAAAVWVLGVNDALYVPLTWSVLHLLQPLAELAVSIGDNSLVPPGLMDELAERFGVGDVEVLVYKSRVLVTAAYAGFASKRIYIHEDLARGLSRDELRAVIAHELAHCALGHALKAELAHALACVLATFAYPLLGLAGLPPWARLLAAFPLFALPSLLVRRFELEADALAAEAVGREVYAATLVKLESWGEKLPSLHPRLEERLRAAAGDTPIRAKGKS